MLVLSSAQPKIDNRSGNHAPSPQAAAPATAIGPEPCLRLTSRALQAFSVGIGLARFQLQAGLGQDVRATLDQLHGDIQTLRRRLEGESDPGVRPSSQPRKPRRTRCARTGPQADFGRG